jgi:general stress protein YciG
MCGEKCRELGRPESSWRACNRKKTSTVGQVGGTETTSREARNDRETDQSIVLRDGRAVHTGKGLTEIRNL